MAKLLTFAPDTHSTPRLGAFLGDQVLDMRRAYLRVFQGTPPDWFGSVGEVLNGGEPALALVRELLQRVGANREPSELHHADRIVFGLPTGTSPKVLCVTMNYA